VEGFCRLGNESSGSIGGVEFLGYLIDYQIFIKDSAVWRQLIYSYELRNISIRD
jgi:hypothetical protein